MSLDLKPGTLKKKKIGELKELLERVRTSVANKTVSDVWSDSILGAISVGESVIKMTPVGDTIYIQGLSEALKEDETFLDLLEELRLENQNLSYVSPYVRVAYTVLTTGAKVHSMNALMIKHEQKKANSVSNLFSKSKTQTPPTPPSSPNHKKIVTKTEPGIIDLDN
jgi:hypothetical protein